MAELEIKSCLDSYGWLHLYFSSNKLCLRYRVLKVEMLFFSCLSFRQPLNNIHEDIFCVYKNIGDPEKGITLKFIVWNDLYQHYSGAK